MKIELLLFSITAFFVMNTYYDGKYLKLIKNWKKYYQMIGIVFAGLSMYLFLKKHPNESRSFFQSASGFISVLPIDKQSKDILIPLITKNTSEEKIMNSGNKPNTKRCVSETKKKYVASQQNWKCKECGRTLPAWFEVDHTKRLDQGGTNHIDNLVALCRDCHGKKTAFENL